MVLFTSTNYTKVQDYAIVKIKSKKYGTNVPVIMDYKDYIIIKDLKKSWYLNEAGMVTTTNIVQQDGEEIINEIYLHELIMALKTGKKREDYSILHINKLGIDNRRENLIYNKEEKEVNKNMKKKKRIISLPAESGIYPEEIPTYIWYLKPDSSHGERFVVDVGDYNFKTTSSKHLSLRYKLEEAKKYLRELKDYNPEIFEENCMNGEFNKKGKELLNSFFEITSQAGFKNLKKLSTDNLTDKYLKEKQRGLSKYEKELLNSKTFFN